MKISNLYSSKSLSIKNIRTTDLESVIKPCLKELKAIAKKAKITISSDSFIKETSNFRTINPSLSISIMPSEKQTLKSGIMNFSYLLPKNAKDRKNFLKFINDIVELLKTK